MFNQGRSEGTYCRSPIRLHCKIWVTSPRRRRRKGEIIASPKDPICGMLVEEGEHALKTTRYATTYYFCSETCLVEFEAPEKAIARLKRLVVLGALLTVPIAALTYLPILSDRAINNLVMFFFSLPVQFVAGFRFYRGSYDALRSRIGNMDLLIGLGTSAAWIYSTIVTFVPGFFPGTETYFETSAIIITLIQTGNL